MSSDSEGLRHIPWARVVVEGAVVILSILLAFAIDAGWDERQSRSDEQEMLASLKLEFEANRAEAAGVVSVHERGRELLAAAHARTPGQTADLSLDSVSATLTALAMPRTFDAIRGTLDALIGSGRLDLIRDRELRRALTIFLNMVDDSAEDAAYMAEGSRRVWDLQIVRGGPWRRSYADLAPEGCDAPVRPSTCYLDFTEWDYFPEPTATTLVSVMADDQLMGQVRQLRNNVARYVAEVRRLQDQIDLVLSLVERSLD